MFLFVHLSFDHTDQKMYVILGKDYGKQAQVWDNQYNIHILWNMVELPYLNSAELNKETGFLSSLSTVSGLADLL